MVVERDAENDLVRSARDTGCVVLLGDATELYMLRRAGIGRARHVVAVCRDDGLNAGIAVRTQDLAARSGGWPHCVCHVFDLRLWSLPREQPDRIGAAGGVFLEFGNLCNEGAVELLKNGRCFLTRRPGLSRTR